MRKPVAHIVCASPEESCMPQVGEGDFLVAADGGFATCKAAELVPDLVVGDFDSLPGGKPEDLPCPCVELPQAKDDTDLMVCLRECLDRGFEEIRVYKALGGDLGHTVAAIKAASWAKSKGTWVALYGCGQSAFLVGPEDGEVQLSVWCDPRRLDAKGCLKPGTRVNIFAFGGDAAGVCEYGLRWELDGALMLATDHYGVSNEVAGNAPRISVADGMLLVVVG